MKRAIVRKYPKKHTQALAQREAQQRMEEFLSIAGHELKTPLTSIKGNIQLVQRRIKSGTNQNSLPQDEAEHTLAEIKSLLEHTDEQIARLSRLVNSFLESSRNHTPPSDLLVELCELDQLIREVVNERQGIPTARKILVDVPEGKTLLVLADTKRIQQVITHYLSNAHKFSPLDKPIEVYLREQRNMAHVTVRDEGPGIPPREQKRIWDRFYRSPDIKVLNGSEVGLGLGLYLSRMIISQHQGRVGLQSMPGAGSTFWFTLPLLQFQYPLAGRDGY
ncbi:MAG TPA: HAMP domain-containing sensor histidine kinase [Ktedonobacteraceae bacterium]|nr:HAMP domain-containing sensor histidine kinase [Ktedonobacteraceae bacterium]